MNRILIPLAMVVLVAGCAMPSLFGQQAEQPVAADTAQTVVVREVYHETPVVYVDTVYMAADPEPVQPVYVENEYNEYSEYNYTDVYVHEDVVVPPPRPYRHERRWSPREHERRPADRRGDDESGRDRNKPGGPDKPEPVNPKHPVKKVDVLVGNDRQQDPVPPTVTANPAPPARRGPAKGRTVPVVQVKNEPPKQAPAPAVDKPVAPASDRAQLALARAVRK